MGGESEKLNFSFLLCSEAWLLLRKKRYQEKILERTDNQLENLEKMVCLQMYKLYLCSPLSQTSNSNESSRENATQSISTSPLTYYQDVPQVCYTCIKFERCATVLSPLAFSQEGYKNSFPLFALDPTHSKRFN